MSVSFSGWEVSYDTSPHIVELRESQEPKDKGVYTMYHGTSLANARLIIANGFQQSSNGMLGRGVYISRNKKKAERYPIAHPANDRVVLEVRVRVGKVKRIDTDNHPMQYTWNTGGYDTAWVPPKCNMSSVPSGMEEDCVFDPKRVEVKAIALAPSTTVQTELEQLLAKSPNRPPQGSGDGGVCLLCKRKTLQGHTHNVQQCWGCGQNICILMTKHVCLASA